VKITFEGQDIADIIDQVSVFIADVVLKVREYEPEQAAKPPIAPPRNKPVPEMLRPVVKPVENPVDFTAEKPKRVRTEKQLANDEKLRERAAAKKALGLRVRDPMPKVVATAEEPEVPPAKPVDPVEMVKIRQKTIEDLQQAYANGHQQEVFELLSRFGNGAKSFRELPPDAFVPISEAIAKGALT
jgi:hypothetical protein